MHLHTVFILAKVLLLPIPCAVGIGDNMSAILMRKLRYTVMNKFIIGHTIVRIPSLDFNSRSLANTRSWFPTYAGINIS